jgi:FeS assembly SUF system protein
MKPLPMVPQEAPEPPARINETAGHVPDPRKTAEMKPAIVQALSTVFDPEIPVNIWELGLIYDIAVDAAGVTAIRMTLTAPGCPVAQSLPCEVADKVKGVAGVSDARVDIVWDPPWEKDRMSDAAKLQLGMW